MIARLIRWSVANRFLVLLATVMFTAWGVWGVRSTPVDALPDLSDVQVIIRTSYPGQAPQIVENQVTYPLATTMLSVPGAKTVRGFSFFGDSFVYILFEDGTDLYWARSRVLEYMNQVQGRLPATAKSSLGPDATGVGWIYQYALVDRTGKNDLAQLRALQDWFLKFELKSLPNVAEVASVGGMVKQYQVVLDPIKLAAQGLTQGQVREAILGANQETGGSVLELSGAEYMVRASGYLKTLDDFRAIPLVSRAPGFPCVWAMSQRCRSDRRCGAASPNSTARGKWPVAWWSCARARMPRKPSKPSRPSSASCKAACPRAWRSSPPTTAAHSLSGRSRTSQPNSSRSSSWWLWSVSCSSGTCVLRWSPSFLCRWGSWRRFW